MSVHLIQSETLEAIGDEVRRLTETERPLSPSEMATALAGVSGGGSLPPCDEYKFFGYSFNPNIIVGENGEILADADDSRLWGLEYLRTHYVAPPMAQIGVDEWNHDLYFGDMSGYMLVSAKLPAITSFVTDGEHATVFGSDPWIVNLEAPACMEVGDCCFGGHRVLERVVLNSACEIGANSFCAGDDRDSTLKLYLKGTTMGTCSQGAFGTDGAVPENVEIYVPPSLLNDFKTSWADGAFASIIYADPEVSA